jgi:hypothetical protein
MYFFDIVIPLGPNDYSDIHNHIKHCKNNVKGHRNIYIITALDIQIDDCITVPENSTFPFTLKDISIRPDRNGWYFQQLLKLYAYFIPGILENYLVIDADTYFLRPTDFFENNIPLYGISGEHHLPYFSHLKLLNENLIRKNNYSGICHHMMFNATFLKEMKSFICPDENPEESFWKLFIDKVNPKELSGASEYELYFNYMLLFHPESIKVRPLQWTNKSNITNYDYLNYDYVSVHWYLR